MKEVHVCGCGFCDQLSWGFESDLLPPPFPGPCLLVGQQESYLALCSELGFCY